MTQHHAAFPHMAARRGPDPVLEGLAIEGAVDATFARIRMRQAWRNASATNVEVLYTFPLPLQSTLLDVVTELGGKRLRGRVVARAAAEKKYEKAISEGDTAVMVERPEPGLYVMSLGNLMAGEAATIELEFAMLLDWQGSRLRLSLPTTLAPRYGEERSRLQPQQKPMVDARVERTFSLDLSLSRAFARCRIASPTHRIAVKPDADATRVSLERGDEWMNRDFVLTADAEAAPAPFACVAPDREAGVFYASFQVPSAGAAAESRAVKIVLDCSGSMNGESIACARAGVLKLIEGLRPRDRFGLLAFGSTVDRWTGGLRAADELGLEAASAWVRARAADMGGTEMGLALQSAIAMGGAEEKCDLFLVTDGEIADAAEVIDIARRSRHRVFVVGVGTAPQQDVLRELAESTGGAIEWVTPGERMADAIHRLFSRLVEVPVRDLHVRSGTGFEWEAHAPASAVFSGDTVHFFGRPLGHHGEVVASWTREDGTNGEIVLRPDSKAPSENADALARVAAGMRIRALERKGAPGEEIARLAEDYQLVTSETHFVLVAGREDRATDMPQVRHAPHMLAEGWGGIGASMDLLSASEDIGDLCGIDFERMAISPPKPASRIAGFLENAEREHSSLAKGRPLEHTIASLRSLGLPEDLVQMLEEMAKVEPEPKVVRAFWLAMLALADSLGLSRHLRRALSPPAMPEAAALVEAIRTALVKAIPLSAVTDDLTIV